MPIYGHFCVKIAEFSPTFTENEPKSPKIRYFSSMYPIFNHFSIKFQSNSGTFDWVQIFIRILLSDYKDSNQISIISPKSTQGTNRNSGSTQPFVCVLDNFVRHTLGFLVFETVKRPLYHNKQIK